jgi:hypothetical protein
MIGMIGGGIVGWVGISESLASSSPMLSLVGALFVGLVIGVFTFLLGLVVFGKD